MRDQPYGYLLPGDYVGRIKGDTMNYPTEGEYLEMLDESEEEDTQ